MTADTQAPFVVRCKQQHPASKTSDVVTESSRLRYTGGLDVVLALKDCCLLNLLAFNKRASASLQPETGAHTRRDLCETTSKAVRQASQPNKSGISVFRKSLSGRTAFLTIRKQRLAVLIDNLFAFFQAPFNRFIL
ncbi:hypothetical protein EDC90_102816 [Martelella mediterranea]|uniref:Uncharacterized protein n=1 Tax=Martelella mediterranea TaxID=293089 RepID=A0A4R3NLH6_9HYPH|nr:hypothetical protein EDC90_102816 [Martelella mediterranea]